MSLWLDPNDRHSDSDVLKAILRQGDVYVDVGANIGHLAIEAATLVGDSGKVTAFEAHPCTAGFLRQNILLNKLSNIRIAQVAVGNQLGWVNFSNQNSDDQNNVTDGEGIAVPLVTLDALLPDEPLTILKIDVEGFEKYVLEGAKKTLDKTAFIYFEAWDAHFQKYGYEFSEIFDFLSEKKFKIAEFLSHSSLEIISRDRKIPNCINLLAYRDESAIMERTNWSIQ
ncbi:FkbM family methyltransferase [Thiobaca trueperi]|nr:FkbM family methyltransferase [Thiobaca trueperi]